MDDRFLDTGGTIHAFFREMLVTCPRCGSCAVSRPVAQERDGSHSVEDTFSPRRLSCVACGLSRDWAKNHFAVQKSGADPYFDLPLWLQAPCCGEVLWAYNPDHLTFIENFVRATLRERRPPSANDSARNATLASRLPRWLKDSKNRAAVLGAIASIRQARLSR